MTLRRAYACLLAVLVITACRTVAPPVAWQSPVGRDHPLTGRIWDVAGSRFADEPGLVATLTRARYVLLGEKHDNADHHRLQAQVLAALVAGGGRPTVAFEMFTSAQASALARHLAERPRDAAGVADAVGWKTSGWPDFRMYEPIIAVALGAGLPIVAANLDAAEVRALRRDGHATLDPAFVARHRLETPPPPDLERAMTDEIRDAHCGHAPERIIPGMVVVQRARDARLAEALLTAPGRDGAVLIAGAGHVRNDRGVPAYLRPAAPDARVAAVAFVEVERSRQAPADYGERFGGRLPFDYVWFTPAVAEGDPCEAFRKSLERLRR